MKKFLFTIILFLAWLAQSPLIKAETASESASPSAKKEVTENLKKRLKDSLKDAQQNLITTKELDNSPKAFVGTVKDVIQETIEIQTKDGVYYSKTNQESTILRTPGNSEIELEDVRMNDFIIAMGYLQKTDTTILGKRIIVSQKITPQLKKQSGKAKIAELTSSSITLDSSEKTTLNLSSETNVKNKSEILKLESLEKGQEIIYTATIDDEKLTATNIMIISQ